MRQIHRLALQPATIRTLRARTRKVLGAADPSKEAARLWKQLRVKAFDEVREKLREMAPGDERCMYCEDSAGTDIEHFRPKSDYPDQAFTWTNYLLACSHCNSNEKRCQFPLDAQGQPLLIDPCVDDPQDHLQYSVKTGKYAERTDKGQKSCEVFGLNRQLLVRGRYRARAALQSHLEQYSRYRTRGEMIEADRLRDVIIHHPFDSVLLHLLAIASKPTAQLVINKACLQVLKDHPDIQTWIS